MSKEHCHESECCSTHHHHHDHDDCCHHHHDECCHEHEDFAHQLLALADEAWMEVLKEKIKENIREHNGKQLDELAKIVSEGNNQRWRSKLGIQHDIGHFRDNIDKFFKK